MKPSNFKESLKIVYVFSSISKQTRSLKQNSQYAMQDKNRFNKNIVKLFT